jgi:hypothetical protein
MLSAIIDRVDYVGLPANIISFGAVWMPKMRPTDADRHQLKDYWREQ